MIGGVQHGANAGERRGRAEPSVAPAACLLQTLVTAVAAFGTAAYSTDRRRRRRRIVQNILDRRMRSRRRRRRVGTRLCVPIALTRGAFIGTVKTG